MAQHVVLLTVARAAARARAAVAAALARVPAPVAPLGRARPRRLGVVPARRPDGVPPRVAFALMTAALAVWHVPALYDAAVRNEGVHILEHVCFLGTALLFWGALLEAPPVRARIDHLHRAAWFGAALLPGWILAIVLAYASTPLYGAYASLAHRPGGLSALSDQQLAAGVMWVPGSLAYLIAGIYFFYRWLEPGTPPLEPRHEELSWT